MLCKVTQISLEDKREAVKYSAQMIDEISSLFQTHYQDRSMNNVLEGGQGWPGGTVVRNHLPVQKTQEKCVGSLGQEDPLEEEMAIHSSILAWKTSWTEEPGYSPWARKESDTTEGLNTLLFIFK